MTIALKDLPHPKGLPLVGNFFDVDPRRFHLILENWCDELGPVFTFRIAHRQILCLAYPDEINRILRDRPETFRRRKTFETVIKEMLYVASLVMT